ncbi:MAG TPA: hypothetical protein VFG47_07845, partial [Geminicoccaceae bacterium]|nr:hypothetical protein [Geminicoccaceae bacterium]
MIPGRRRRAPAAAALALAGWCLATLPLAAQQPPVPLFPPTMPEPAPPPPPSPREPAPDREAGRLAPPPEPAVQVERLAPPSVDAIGLPAPEGLGDDVWDGGDPRAALDLLERLPARTANPALRALTRRLLASGGPPVDGGGEEGRPLALRVERLLAMGELDAALALLGRLPAGQGGEALERLAAEALLLAGGTDDACARGGEGGARSFQGPFWSKLGALCRLRAGERAEARLAVELLREETGRGGGEADDPLLFALFDTIDAGAGGGSVEGLPPAAADGPSPLHLALLREARLPVPGEPLDRLAPGHLAAIARDSATPAARRVAAAERAAALGALPAGELAAVYGDADLGGPPAADPSALA